MTYRLIGDSCTDLDDNLKKDENISIVPLTLEIGDYSVIDDDKFDQKDFIRRMARSKAGAKSACPSPEAFKEAMECDVDMVFVVTLSEHLSGSYQSAEIGKKLFEENKEQYERIKNLISLSDLLEKVDNSLTYENSILKISKYDIVINLEKEGFNFISAEDGEEGINKVLNEKPDLLLLDVMIPKMDGLSVCKKIRQENINIPIIMLSARGEEIDKVLGLEIGADDYITKPFSPREVIARIKANLRKFDKNKSVEEEQKNQIAVGSLILDLDKFEAIVRGTTVTDLTRREFEVLKFLAQKPGQIVTRETLLEKVWGYEYYGDIRTVDVTVRRIREKIEKNTSNPKIIITKRGVGYYLANK